MRVEYGTLENSSRMLENEVLLPERAPSPVDTDRILDFDDLSFKS